MTAAQKGQRHERAIADFLRFRLGKRWIDIRPKNGRLDRGDVGGVETYLGSEIVIEAKNHNRLELSTWLKEAEREAANANVLAGVVVHKRKGVGDPAEQFVTMSLDTFAWLLMGGPDSGDAA